MKQTDWQQIDEILESLLELPEDQRSARVDQLCAGNATLRSEIVSLLAAHNHAGSFLEGKTQISSESSFSLVSKQLGTYRLFEAVGHGGMGTVYRAERADGQFQKQVAVKVVPAAIYSQELLRRFNNEQQILATLEHPNIARLLDAGVSPDGLPYLVMEYVEGIPITDYCRERILSVQERLHVFQTVCSAVHYAHQHLIVHRDIKPANILVTDEGIPKLLDFGIAKLLDPWQSTGVGWTRSIFNPMTPDHASPEQARGEALTTATDVYSLGVILYELLANQRPYSVVGKSPRDAVRMICELEPEKPSAVVRNRMKREPEVPREPALSSELDAVVAKAMRKDPQQRYDSAQDLAQDISRYLGGLTVVAHRGSLRYSVTKFIARHKLAAASALTMFALVVAGVTAIIWQAQVAIRERETAKAVNDFLQNDLLARASAWNQAGPSSKPDPDIKVRTVLDRAAANVTGKFQKQPLVEASIRHTIGNTYSDLGLYAEAQQQFERVLDLRRHVLGEEHRETLSTIYQLGDLYQAQGKYAQAESFYSRALEAQRRVLGEMDRETVRTMHGLGVLDRNQGKYAEAEQWLTKALELQRRVPGKEDPETLLSMNSLAALYRRQGKYRQAQALYLEALEIQRRLLGEEHPDTLISMNNLAVSYKLQGRYSEAESLYVKAMQIRRRVLGDEHPSTLISMNNLALLYAASKPEQAEPLFIKVLEERRRVLGHQHPSTLNSMNDLARLYSNQGRWDQAETLLMEALEGRRRVLGEQHPDTMDTLALVGQVRIGQKRFAEAESMLRKTLDASDGGPGSWERYHCQTLLGTALVRQGKFAEAEPTLKGAYRGLAEREATIPWENQSAVQQASQRIIELYERWGKAKEAEAWRRGHPPTSRLASSVAP